jgi:hypothetical protein
MLLLALKSILFFSVASAIDIASAALIFALLGGIVVPSVLLLIAAAALLQKALFSFF